MKLNSLANLYVKYITRYKYIFSCYKYYKYTRKYNVIGRNKGEKK